MEGLMHHSGEMTVLISSHELAEIENVTTHVAFLDRGTVLFQEAMSDLTARLRQVRVTLEAEAPAPVQTPKEWLDVRTVGNVLSFVDTRFSEPIWRCASLRWSATCATSRCSRSRCAPSIRRSPARCVTTGPA